MYKNKVLITYRRVQGYGLKMTENYPSCGYTCWRSLDIKLNLRGIEQ